MPDAPSVSVLDSHETLQALWSIMPTALVHGQRIAWDCRRHALVLVDSHGAGQPVDHAMAHSWLSTVAQSVPSPGARIRPLTISQSRLILDSIRHQIGHDLMPALAVRDPLVDRWRATRWDGRQRLGLPLWRPGQAPPDSPYLHGDGQASDPFGIRCHIITKIYIEIIGRSMGLHWPAMDEMLVLIGPQGIGKSVLGSSIAGPSFCRSLTSSFEATSSYDAVATLCSAAIVEFEEMTVIRELSSEAIKALVTRTHLTARSPKSLSEVRFRRLYVAYGTSNNPRCIPADAAGRRWLPVCIGAPNSDLLWEQDNSVARWVSRWSDQLGAEALHLIGSLPAHGSPSMLYPSIQTLTEEQQRWGQMAYVIDDCETEHSDVIYEVLACHPATQRQPIHITWWRQVLAPLGCRGRSVARALRAAGWRQVWVGSGRQRRRAWVGEAWDPHQQDVLMPESGALRQRHPEGTAPAPAAQRQKRRQWDPSAYDWRALLTGLCGVDEGLLDGRGRPCPNCGGHDRFQWFGRDDGGWHCRHCGGKDHTGGGGSGLDMVMRLRPQWSVDEAMRQVEAFWRRR